MALACPADFHSYDGNLSKLLAILGKRKFATLQKALGGNRVWIPKHGTRIPCELCSRRNRCIRLWKRRGFSVIAIARFLQVSPKTVYRIAKRKSRS